MRASNSITVPGIARGHSASRFAITCHKQESRSYVHPNGGAILCRALNKNSEHSPTPIAQESLGVRTIRKKPVFQDKRRSGLYRLASQALLMRCPIEKFAARKAVSPHLVLTDDGSSPRRLNVSSVLSLFVTLVFLLFSFAPTFAAVPLVLHFQGHIASGGVSVDGPGEFKFSLIDAGGSISWSNSPFPAGGDQPLQSVVLTIQKGFYSVRLGDSVIPNMAPLTLSAFQAENLKLRIWFNDGQQGFEQLTPDQPLAASAFAVSAARAETAGTVESIPEGLIEQRHLPADFVGQVASLNAQITAMNEQLAFLNDIANSALTLSNSVVGSFRTMAAVSVNPEDPLLVAGGFRRFTTLEASGWETGATERAPLPRFRHTGVWTGNEFVIWGGNLPGDITGDGGGMYRPAADEWISMSPVNALSDRRSHTAVWTGSEVIFWGGLLFSGKLGHRVAIQSDGSNMAADHPRRYSDRP